MQMIRRDFVIDRRLSVLYIKKVSYIMIDSAIAILGRRLHFKIGAKTPWWQWGDCDGVVSNGTKKQQEGQIWIGLDRSLMSRWLTTT